MSEKANTSKQQTPGIDFGGITHWNEVEAAWHGDLRPLIALLRSEAPISRIARNYLADELEHEPKKRFARRGKRHLALKKADRLLLLQVHNAKLALAYHELEEATEDQRLDHAADHWQKISDERALDLLAEQGIEADRDKLRNARVRIGPSHLNPKKHENTDV